MFKLESLLLVILKAIWPEGTPVMVTVVELPVALAVGQGQKRCKKARSQEWWIGKRTSQNLERSEVGGVRARHELDGATRLAVVVLECVRLALLDAGPGVVEERGLLSGHGGGDKGRDEGHGVLHFGGCCCVERL